MVVTFQFTSKLQTKVQRWTEVLQMLLIKQAGPGTSIFFDQISVKGPDGKVRELPRYVIST